MFGPAPLEDVCLPAPSISSQGMSPAPPLLYPNNCELPSPPDFPWFFKAALHTQHEPAIFSSSRLNNPSFDLPLLSPFFFLLFTSLLPPRHITQLRATISLHPHLHCSEQNLGPTPPHKVHHNTGKASGGRQRAPSAKPNIVGRGMSSCGSSV